MKIISLNNNNYDEIIKEGKVLVDFYAKWCGPCKMLAPVLEQFANENDDIKVVKVNVDEHGELAQSFGIMSIPTLLFYNDGMLISRTQGFMTKEKLIEWIEQISK